MADGVNLPPAGTGDTGVKASTQKVTADSSDVQDVALASVVAGVRTRVSAAAPLPVVQTGTPGLPTGAATEATLLAGNVLEGGVTESAPATDTASSGLNGRLQRVAQRLTSLIAQIPATLGQKTMANSLAVTVASDQAAVPVSAAALPLPAGAATSAIMTDGTQRSRLVDGAGTNLLSIDSSGRAFMDLRTLNGTAVDRNTGVAGNGTQRVVLATDQAALTNPQPANLYVQGAQVDVNGGNRSNSTMRVVIATDQPQLSSAFFVTNAGTFPVQNTQPSASTGAVSAFTATSSTLVFSANAAAKLRTFANDSDKDLYLYFRAAAVSATTYHVKVRAGAFLDTDYTGEVRGIMSAAIGSGQVNCGEFT